MSCHHHDFRHIPRRHLLFYLIVIITMIIFYHVIIITSFTTCGELSSPRAEDQPQDRREGTAVGEAGCNDDLDIDVDE